MRVYNRMILSELTTLTQIRMYFIFIFFQGSECNTWVYTVEYTKLLKFTSAQLSVIYGTPARYLYDTRTQEVNKCIHSTTNTYFYEIQHNRLGDVVPDKTHFYRAMVKVQERNRHDCIFHDKYCDLKETYE